MSLKKQLAAYAKVVTKRQAAARGLTVYPDDTFLVSYPRSGNTWTRFLVCNLINPDNPVARKFRHTEPLRVGNFFEQNLRARRLLPEILHRPARIPRLLLRLALLVYAGSEPLGEIGAHLVVLAGELARLHERGLRLVILALIEV